MARVTAPLGSRQTFQQPQEPALLDEVIEKTAAKLDELSNSFFIRTRDPNVAAVHRAVELAKNIRVMRDLLTDKIMEALFMPLMNSALGFLTDCGTAKSKNQTPYSREIVRDCLIDAMLCGFRPTGNEFNIIAGRAMGVLNGWRRLCEEIPGITDLRISPQPVQWKEQRAYVRVGASWKLIGVAGELRDADGKNGITFEIPTSGGFSGPDAIIGKAQRRAYKLVYQMLTGTQTTLPDGEVGDQGGEQRPPISAADLGRQNLRNGGKVLEATQQALAAGAVAAVQTVAEPQPALVEGEVLDDTPEILAAELIARTKTADATELRAVTEEARTNRAFLGDLLYGAVRQAIYDRDDSLGEKTA